MNGNLSTQTSTVKEILQKQRKITRNQALSMGITRLSAIIDNLKNEGYIIENYWLNKDHTDYVYELKGYLPLSNVNTEIKIISTVYNNLNDLEHYVSKETNRLKAKGKEVVPINIYEPVLNVVSNIFTMPKRNIVILSSEKSAYVDKISFNIMNVFESVKKMFFDNGKKTYLKNRANRIIKKHKTKNADSDKKVVFLIYGLNDKYEEDQKFKKFLEKELIK